jgi:Tfp pilus assembly protein PilE
MRTRPSRSLRGFTVVELMISLCVGGIAISSLYAVGAASTRHFREQQRISTTQTSLRSAMNQLKRDFARAGYLATPNASVNGEWCGAAPTAPLNDSNTAIGRGRLAAISAFHKGVAKPASLDPDDLNKNFAIVDDVILMGNYATSGEYMDVQIAPDLKTFTVPTTSQGFTRDFTNWYAADGKGAGACSDVALQTAFPPGRLVRVRNRADTNGFGQVERAACSGGAPTALIELKTQINGCNPTGGWISPINTIRYHVDDAGVTEQSRIGVNRVSVLRRTEVDPADKTKALTVTEAGVTRNADDRAVLDYVVRFNVDFLMHANGAPRNVILTPAPEANVQANPEFIRGAIIELAARTAEHEPDMDVSLSAARLPPFRVFKTQGAARTRSLRAELFLPNIAYEGY